MIFCNIVSASVSIYMVFGIKYQNGILSLIWFHGNLFERPPDAAIMYDAGVIRRATIHDLPEIIKLEQKCFHTNSAYTPKQLLYLITRANSNCLLQQLNHSIQGSIIVLYKQGSEVAGIETISVDPHCRGQGIGKRLLGAAEKDMIYRGIQKIRLEVSIGNFPAIQLYQKSGFRITTILKDYYTYEKYGSHDAYRMIRELTT